MVILGFPRVFCGSRVIMEILGVGAIFNQSIIIIISIVSKNVYKSSIRMLHS